ncbi:MAG: CtsR family transcriptional regulator [Clostridia bacterium]|nr:CtsR family transcriptional regulator [Clostridia bacterium]
MRMSDIIESYINELIEAENEIEIKRSDLAMRFNCVPSQINYVISTRFNTENGFIVESRRGGGGGIKIKKIYFEKEDYLMHLINSIGNSIKQQEAYAYIKNMYDKKLISLREGEIMISAVSDNALLLEPVLKDAIRARILKNMIIKLKG